MVGEHGVEAGDVVREQQLHGFAHFVVQVLAGGEQDGFVGDLLGQGVLEGVLALSARARDHEPGLLQVRQDLIQSVLLEHLGEDWQVEGAADHRRRLKDVAPGRIQRVDPGHDHFLDRPRDHDRLDPLGRHEFALAYLQGPLVDQRAHDLFGEEGVAPRLLLDGSTDVLRDVAASEEVVDQAARVVFVEGRDFDLRVARRVSFSRQRA